ncbi:MAG: SPFH domain-containing protein, partial [Oscillospiraceae bacterium]|nr:SPFH domain-containing protein [Oscillospiraceae bacterium]
MAIIDVIKYDGPQDIFAWKYPNDELGTWTQLIVNESQEVMLFKGGAALDLFGPGRHTLTTANIPLLSKLINLPFGGRSPFKAEVWYINKLFSLDIKWGTATPIQLQDPKYNVFVPLRSYGQFGIQIGDARTFLTKLVGTLPSFSKEHVLNYFRGLYLTKVKDSISSYLIKKTISVLEINAYLDELSEHLRERMAPVLSEFGINLVNFYVNDINVPEEDPAVKKLKGALAKRAEMDIIGYNYTQERSFDTLEGAAKNPSSGQAGLMGAGVGLGMGVGIGGAFGEQMGGISRAVSIKETKTCPECGGSIDADKRFCAVCGHDTHVKTEKKAFTDKVACNKCGFLYDRGAKFCPECGDKYNPCPFCGADLPEGSLSCDKCGKAFRVCGKCGAVGDGAMKFCAECGEPMAPAAAKSCPDCGNPIEGTPK